VQIIIVVKTSGKINVEVEVLSKAKVAEYKIFVDLVLPLCL
jgi:hypothetical protein